MVDLFIEKITDTGFMTALLVAIAAAAAVFTVAMPLVEPDTLNARMRAVSTERDRIRARERERLAKNANGRGSLRAEPKAYMANIVEQFSLSKWLGTEKAKTQLAMAGFRGPQAEITFLFFRLISPISLAFVSAGYVFGIAQLSYSMPIRAGICVLACYIGIKLPELYLRNTITKRKLSLTRAYPDALDLMLICVESGMSVENAFRKVAAEIGQQSVPMAEELSLTTAELAYLPERRTAYDNLATRTGLESMRAIVTVLVQAERYGTPLGTALRVLAQESRDARMALAEKKAASLPPKLTVPMVLFFLPVLFIIIGTPAVIQVMRVAG